MRVLVTTYKSAGDRIALAAVRALFQNGASVVLGSDDLSTPSFRSSRLYAKAQLTSPILCPQRHARDVMAVAADQNVDVVLPTDDYAVSALIRFGDLHDPRLRTTIPPEKSFLTTKSKVKCNSFAQSVGLDVPKTILAPSPEIALEFGHDVGFPIVLKINSGNGAVGFAVVANKSDIGTYYRSRIQFNDGVFDHKSIVAQQYMHGETHDLCAVFRSGRLVSALTSKRLATYPQKSGAGILVETTHREDILFQGCKLLEALKWNGPAQVEFKVHKNENPKFIEVNGRLWGTLAVSTAAGINFPDLCCRSDGDLPKFKMFDYEIGLRYRWVLPYFFFLLADGAFANACTSILLGGRKCKSEVELGDIGPTLSQLSSLGRLVRKRHTALSPAEIKAS